MKKRRWPEELVARVMSIDCVVAGVGRGVMGKKGVVLASAVCACLSASSWEFPREASNGRFRTMSRCRGWQPSRVLQWCQLRRSRLLPALAFGSMPSK